MHKVYVCPRCNSDDTAHHGYDDGEEIFKCCDCGHKFTWDETGKWWEEDESYQPNVTDDENEE